MVRFSGVVVCLAALAAATPAEARGPSPSRSAERARSARLKPKAPERRPRSLGSPSDGRLENGIAIEQSGVLKLKRPRGPRWALSELVAMLERSAKRVEARFPGSIQLVGNLWGRRGGDIGGHRSHESGRDADVGFFFTDARGRPVEVRDFHAVDWRGRAVGAPALYFDDARNWALIESWVTDPHSTVEHIFVAKPIRARLLAHARRRGVYLPVLHRASIALKQPSRGLPHDDHFHVRVACPRSQRDTCLADPPSRQSAERRALVDRPKGRKNDRR